MQLEVNIESKTFENAARERQDVLAGINFTLGASEVGVIIGPSGCGKSTMLRILAGLDHDYQGRVSRPLGARLGMVFQEPRLLAYSLTFAAVVLVIETALVQPFEARATRWRPRAA